MVIMVGIGAVLYLFSRALPRIDNKEEKFYKSSQFAFYMEKADKWLKIFIEKFLRKARLILFKVDNKISEKLNKFKKEPPRQIGFPNEEEKKKE